MFRTGFLGYPTTFMLDFVVCALVLIVPVLLYSLWLVKVKRSYTIHMKLQLALGVVLLIAVASFEIDVQWVHGGWEKIVAQQPLEEAELAAKIAAVKPWLYLHLLFAVTTPFLWIATIFLALRRFGLSPVPGVHSRTHAVLGWASAVDIALTSVTGLLFYYVTFVR